MLAYAGAHKRLVVHAKASRVEFAFDKSKSSKVRCCIFRKSGNRVCSDTRRLETPITNAL
eukprot:590138-Prorocentrum_minimum.AAC.2